MAAFPASVFDNEVQYEARSDGVAVITLNAPQRLNSMGRKMNMGVQLALDLAAEDSSVRVIVLTGSGTRAFCVGGNLASADDGASSGFKGRPGDAIPPTTAAAVRTLRTGMGSSLSLREMDKPTIAAVNGACAGAGLSWACACDLRFCADTAIFRTAFLMANNRAKSHVPPRVRWLPGRQAAPAARPARVHQLPRAPTGQV